VLYAPTVYYALASFSEVLAPLESGFYCDAVPYALRAGVAMECGTADGPARLNQTSCMAHAPPWGECRFMVRPDEEEISPLVILAFGLIGLLFDLLLLSRFQKWHAGHATQGNGGAVSTRQGTGADSVPTGSHTLAADEPSCGTLDAQGTPGTVDTLDTGRVNMCSALAHVLADSLRSVTTVVESVLILTFGTDPSRTDSWATLVISLSIIAGASSALVQWACSCRGYLCRDLSTPRSADL
jgi:hypothetical protein